MTTDRIDVEVAADGEGYRWTVKRVTPHPAGDWGSVTVGTGWVRLEAGARAEAEIVARRARTQLASEQQP